MNLLVYGKKLCVGSDISANKAGIDRALDEAAAQWMSLPPER